MLSDVLFAPDFRPTHRSQQPADHSLGRRQTFVNLETVLATKLTEHVHVWRHDEGQSAQATFRSCLSANASDSTYALAIS
jgi:hypothetical protein